MFLDNCEEDSVSELFLLLPGLLSMEMNLG
jgi:hypothetical protein